MRIRVKSSSCFDFGDFSSTDSSPKQTDSIVNTIKELQEEISRFHGPAWTQDGGNRSVASRAPDRLIFVGSGFSFGHFSVIEIFEIEIFLKCPKKINQCIHNVRKGGLMNAVTASISNNMAQMTGISQQKKN